jgi:hypothetical protein
MMNWIVRGLGVAAAAVILTTATAAQPQPETGTVTGSVRRASGPVASARVEVDSGSDSKYGASTTTDRDGRFTITTAPVGAIGVKVYDAKEQVIAQGRGVLRRAGDTINLALQAP